MELNQVNSVSTVTVQLEKPKKILHFSDGTLEEFSDEESDVVKNKKQQVTQEIIQVNINVYFTMKSSWSEVLNKSSHQQLLNSMVDKFPPNMSVVNVK